MAMYGNQTKTKKSQHENNSDPQSISQLSFCCCFVLLKPQVCSVLVPNCYDFDTDNTHPFIYSWTSIHSFTHDSLLLLFCYLFYKLLTRLRSRQQNESGHFISFLVALLLCAFVCSHLPFSQMMRWVHEIAIANAITAMKWFPWIITQWTLCLATAPMATILVVFGFDVKIFGCTKAFIVVVRMVSHYIYVIDEKFQNLIIRKYTTKHSMRNTKEQNRNPLATMRK